jgi:hypothetical protein
MRRPTAGSRSRPSATLHARASGWRRWHSQSSAPVRTRRGSARCQSVPAARRRPKSAGTAGMTMTIPAETRPRHAPRRAGPPLTTPSVIVLPMRTSQISRLSTDTSSRPTAPMSATCRRRAGRAGCPETHVDEKLRVATAVLVLPWIRTSTSVYPSRSPIWRKVLAIAFARVHAVWRQISRVGTRLANGSDGWRRFETLPDCRGRTLLLVGSEHHVWVQPRRAPRGQPARPGGNQSNGYSHRRQRCGIRRLDAEQH